MRYKLLIIDDDIELLKMLKNYLELKGYLVYTAQNGNQALDKMSITPDLIILDVNMPVLDGLEVCRRIRDKISCPILFLTARAEEQDRVKGFLSGGDDYILKPFSLNELTARIEAHLKREERHRKRHRLTFADKLSIDYISKTVQHDDNTIELTKKEYEIIEFLSQNPGQVFDKEQIYEKIWGFDGEGDSKTVTELVRRIRNKLSVYTNDELIQTVWGFGYKWTK